VETNQVLEERIGEWRRYIRRRQAIHGVDVEELEDHLRTEVKTLREAGLYDDEAFLVAVKRLGDLDSLSRCGWLSGLPMSAAAGGTMTSA